MIDEKTGSDAVDRLLALSKTLDPRWMSLRSATMIRDEMLAMDELPKRVLEIGTFCGTGSILLAAIVEPWGGHVTTVDLPWTGTPNKHFAKNVDDWVAELGTPNLDIVRREDGVEGWFREFFESGETPLDFVYLDGGHRWLNIAAQLLMSLEALRPGGLVCMDDITNGDYPDVPAAWQYLVRRVASDHWPKGHLGFIRAQV